MADDDAYRQSRRELARLMFMSPAAQDLYVEETIFKARAVATAHSAATQTAKQPSKPLGAPAATSGPRPASTPAKSRRNKAEREARAIAVLVEHPDWTDVEIAKQDGVEVAPSQLSRWSKFKAARQAQKAQQARQLAHGAKDKAGSIEAWDPE